MTTINSRRQWISRRALPGIFSGIALCMWGGLLLFTYYVQPRSVPAIVVVFILLSAALCCTSTVFIYLISWIVLTRRARRPGILQSLREGGLITAWLIFNLFLSTLHSWSLFITIISFGIIVVIELLVLGQA